MICCGGSVVRLWLPLLSGIQRYPNIFVSIDSQFLNLCVQ